MYVVAYVHVSIFFLFYYPVCTETTKYLITKLSVVDLIIDEKHSLRLLASDDIQKNSCPERKAIQVYQIFNFSFKMFAAAIRERKRKEGRIMAKI